MGVHKTVDEAAENLDKAAAYIPERYKKGVGKADWAGPAGSDEAEANFAGAMTEVIAEKSHQKGIRETDNAFWQKQSADKGGAVIGARIKAAIPRYKTNIRDTMNAAIAASDAAPPKTRDWRENIANRLIPVVEAERKAAGKE